MRNTALALVLLLLVPAALIAAESIELVPGAAELSVRILESDPGRTLIEYSVAGFSREAVAIDGELYYRVSLADEGRSCERGLPALPDVSRSLVIPDASEMSVRIVEADFVDYADTPVAPSKGIIYRNVDPATVPCVFDAFYQGSAWYPSTLASLGEPYIMRDHRGVVVTVNPFQYRPSTRTLRVYDRIVVEVSEAGSGRVNVLTARPQDVSDEFEKIYERHFLNYDTASAMRYAPVGETGNMLVVCYDSFQTAMQPFVEWKNQMGVPCEMVSVTEAGGTASNIAGYIQSYYDTEGLTYVLLVGDAAQVPTLTAMSNDASDPSYSLTAGVDTYPDIFVGRFSAETVGDVETQVLRTVEYERDPQAAAAWYHKGMGVASDQGPGDDGEYDNEHIDNIRADLLAFTYTEVDQIYDPTGTAAMVSSGLNAGRSVINYTGHGSTTSWGSTGFSNTNVNALINDNMLPFIVSVACVNGNFDGYTCFAEAWLRATNGGEPTGAAATYMSSVNQSWDPPMVCQDEIADLLVAEAKRTFGGLCYNGACQMMDEGGDGDDMFLTWHVFGDPSLRVRTDTPAAVSVTHPETVAPGAPDYALTVAGVEGALCALYADGVLYGTATTDAFGNATIPLSDTPAEGDSLTLTVTGFNLDTYVAAVPVAAGATCDIVPATIPVGSATSVTITVRDGGAAVMEDVVVTVNGWGVTEVSDTTDALGEAHFSLSPSYGETLTVVGRETGESYDCLTAGIPVTGASTFSSVDIDASVSSLGVSGHLVRDYEGTITGTCSETAFDVIAYGCGVDASAGSGASGTLDLAVTPIEDGVVHAAVVKSGFGIYEEDLPVEIVYGQLAGEVYEAARAAIEGASVRGYAAGADTSAAAPVFSAVSGAGGVYSVASDLETGDYDIYTAKFGYLENERTVFIEYGANDVDIYLDFAPNGVVSGFVTETGSGLPLTALIRAYRTDTGDLYDETTSDASAGGAYSLTLPYSDYTLAVSADGHIQASTSVTVDEPTETANVSLDETFANILILNDKDGRYDYFKFDDHGTVIGIVSSISETRSADIFAADLVALGYDITQESAETSDPATWSAYDFLISSSGNDTSPISDSAYRAAIESYVAGGGKLLIEGGELGWVSSESPGYPTFMTNVLHIADWGHDSSGDVDVEDAGHALTTAPNVLGSMDVGYTGYGDHDSNTAAGDAHVVCGWSNYSGLSSVQVYDDNDDPSTAQIVYYSFNYEAADAAARLDLLENTVSFLVTPEFGTGVDEGGEWTGTGHFLMRPSPNPFNPMTRLSYGLAFDSHVRICVYNVAGMLVRTLVDGPAEAGLHTATWDGLDDSGRNAASGVYFCRMEAEGFAGAAKMLLLK